jgi:hypothetical protein
VTPYDSPSWSRFFEEFHCAGCGGQEAYRSRPRGFFEQYLLPIMLMRTVRCERCCRRTYVLRTIPVLGRDQVERRHPGSQSQGNSATQ